MGKNEDCHAVSRVTLHSIGHLKGEEESSKYNGLSRVTSRYAPDLISPLDNSQFVLTVRSEGQHPAPVEVRLRQFLKHALRRWGIRCVSITAEAARGLP